MAELTKSAKAHARLSHPVIDSDGHWIEYLPALTEYIKKVIGSDGADRYWAAVGSYFGEPKLDYRAAAREAAAGQRMVGGADQEHAGSRHRDAAQAAPRAHGRPGSGLRRAVPDGADPDYRYRTWTTRRSDAGGCRALNMYAADLFRDFRTVSRRWESSRTIPPKRRSRSSNSPRPWASRRWCSPGWSAVRVPAATARVIGTPWRWTAITTTTRCGRSARNSKSFPPSTPRR